jgi:hypothetical protein
VNQGIEPTEAQLARFGVASGGDDRPFVMVNLNRYREHAAYQSGDVPDGLDTAVSGRDAYARYGAVAMKAVDEVGGQLLWGSSAGEGGPFIGDEERDRWDEVLCLWYPSRAAFFRMIGLDYYAASLVHRRAALERAAVFPVAAAEVPVLDLSALVAAS